MKVLQFGTGRFLRGFFLPLIQHHPGIGSQDVLIVQSRPESQGARDFNNRVQPYHLWIRGLQSGQIMDRVEEIDLPGPAFVAATQWNDLQEVAIDPELRLVVSNTTEKGISLDPDDVNCQWQSECPASFPARLAVLLHRRYEAGLNGVAILPMELVSQNADTLRDLVLRQVSAWKGTDSESFRDWLTHRNRWLNNLVDRMVLRVPADHPWPEDDPLAIVAEPYWLLAIQDDAESRDILPGMPSIEWVSDLTPLFERKVRILNGLHSAMVQHSLPQGFETVGAVLADPAESAWMQALLKEEILPVLKIRIPDVESYARDIWERLANPFFQHRLSDIALNHATKMNTRLLPSRQEYEKLFGEPPPRLTELCLTHDEQ